MILLVVKSQIAINLSSAPVAKNFPSGEKHTDAMYKSPFELVDRACTFSLEPASAPFLASSLTPFDELSSINLAMSSPVSTLKTWVVLLQPVAMNSPFLENLTQHTTEEWFNE